MVENKLMTTSEIWEKEGRPLFATPDEQTHFEMRLRHKAQPLLDEIEREEAESWQKAAYIWIG